MTTASLLEDLHPGSRPTSENPRGRRKDLPVDPHALFRLSMIFGTLTGTATGSLLTTFLALTGLPGAGGSPTVALVALASGLGICALLGGLMREARSSSLKVPMAGGIRTVPVRRRAELVRRALSGLALRVGLLAILVAGVLATAGSGLGIPWAALPRIDREAVTYLATLGAVGATLWLGEILFRLSSREGRVDHAPWILVPSVLGLAMGASGLLP